MAEAEMRCAWCEREGTPAFLYWTDTSDGSPSHGICARHQAQFLTDLEAAYGEPTSEDSAVAASADGARGHGGSNRARDGGGDNTTRQ